MRNFAKIGFLALLVFILGGCSWINVSKNPNPPNISGDDNNDYTIEAKLAKQSNINKFKSYDELIDFLQKNQNQGYGYGYGELKTRGMVADDTMQMENIATSKAINDTGGGSQDYSTTNIQVQGVDEADIIKTDGEYVYALVKDDLFIVNAYPAERATILSKINFKSRPNEIFINGDYLAIFGYDHELPEPLAETRWRPYGNSFTYLKVFDISDRKNPTQIRDIDVEGNYHDARMIGDYVYLVTNNYNFYYLEDLSPVPRILDNEEEVQLDCTSDGSRCMIPDIYYFDIPYNSYNYTNVTAVNIKNQDQALTSEGYILSNSQNLYVSKNNIYITYTKNISEQELEMESLLDLIYPRLSQSDQNKIDDIQSVESYILSDQEKMQKIRQIIERYASTLTADEQNKLQDDLANKIKQKYQDLAKELQKTVIHKIAINDDEIEYQTTGEVTGAVLNQFSMDEKDGYFRIATTKSQSWSRYLDEEESKSFSNLYVLDSDLEQVGAVENLAPGERIYSVRFMQNRAYMVTFEQVDPLFVIDLSNPTNPNVLGKLKIPGFSNYLHPYDENLLIGIGKDTYITDNDRVRTKGIKLSLFDVSEMGDPKEVDTYILGDAGSDSIALHDHKAFLFSKDKNLLVIPTVLREGDEDRFYGDLSFSGATVFNIDKDGFTMKGQIDHSDGGRESKEDYWRGYNYYDNTVKRSLYIDDVLYTFSNNYLKMNQLDDLDLVKQLKLEKNADDDFKVVN